MWIQWILALKSKLLIWHLYWSIPSKWWCLLLRSASTMGDSNLRTFRSSVLPNSFTLSQSDFSLFQGRSSTQWEYAWSIFFFVLRAPWLHVGLLFTNNLGGTWVWSRIYISALLLLPFKQGRGQNQQLYKAPGSLPLYTVSIRERPQSLFDLDLHPDLNFRPVTDHNLWALCVIRRLRCSSSQFFLT